jgi:hypothetical protein
MGECIPQPTLRDFRRVINVDDGKSNVTAGRRVVGVYCQL